MPTRRRTKSKPVAPPIVSTSDAIVIPPPPTEVSIDVTVPMQMSLIWRYNDVDIEFGNRFPYPMSDGTESSNDVADFRVQGKIVKAFLGKDPKYSHTLHLKTSMMDVDRIKKIVMTAPESGTTTISFLWPFEDSRDTEEAVFKFTNKQNLSVDFENIWDMCKMKDIDDVEERNRNKLEIEDVKSGSMALVEFIIALWKQYEQNKFGCSFHLISIGILDKGGDNLFQSPKKRMRITK